MTKQKTDMISFLRVISCLLVMAVHTRMYVSYADGGVLDVITSKGQDGLWIFMILSGYLMGYSFESSKSIKDFYIKRVFRLVPVYWAWLLVIILYSIITKNITISVDDWIRAFFFMTLIIPSKHMAGMWGLGRLSSFMVAYAVFPLLYKKIKKVDAGFFVVIVGLVLKIVTPMVLYRIFMKWPIQSDMDFCGITPLSDMCYFAIGYLIFLGEKACKEKKTVLLLLLLLIVQSRFPLGLETVSLMGLIVAIAIYCPLELPKIVLTACRIVTPITYSIYVCHGASYAFINRYFGSNTQVVRIVLMACFSIIVAVILHILIEKPASRLRKRYIDK